MSPDAVFISADPADRPFVDHLTSYLAAHNVTTVQRQPGADVGALLRLVRAVVVVLSPASEASLAVQAEYVQGSDLQRPLFTVVAAPCPVPMRLRLFPVFSATTPAEAEIAFGQLVAALQTIRYVPPPTSTFAPTPAAPRAQTPRLLLAAIVSVVIIALLAALFIRQSTSSISTALPSFPAPTATVGQAGSGSQQSGITFLTLPSRSTAPSGIAVASDNTAWLTESSANQLGHIAANGTITETPIAVPRPGGIQRGPDGKLWFFANPFFESNAITIERLAADGTLSSLVCTQSGLAITPATMTFDAQGNLWIGGTGGIARCDPTTGALTPYPLNDSTALPIIIDALAVAGNGTVWFAYYNLSNDTEQLFYLDAAGTQHLVKTPHPLRSTAPSLATAADGSVWFTETNYLGHISPTGQITDVAFPMRPQVPSGNEISEVLAPGPHGVMGFITNYQLGEVDGSGHITTLFDGDPTNGSGLGALYMNFAPDGSLWYLLTSYYGTNTSHDVVGHFHP